MTNPEDPKTAESIYDFTVKDIKGNDVPLSNYKGHVCLIVNVASKCGLTNSNYEALNELYDKYGETQGLKILGNVLLHLRMFLMNKEHLKKNSFSMQSVWTSRIWNQWRNLRICLKEEREIWIVRQGAYNCFY